MKFSRKSKTTAVEPTTEAEPVTSKTLEPFDAAAMRDMVFESLAQRVGENNAKIMREDFDGHIAEDPKDGVEVAYLCLLGKIVEVVDKIQDIMEAQSKQSAMSPFAVYRKD